MYGVDSKNPQTKKIVFDYLHPRMQDGKFDEGRKNLSALQRFIFKFCAQSNDEENKVWNVEREDEEGTTEASNEVIPTEDLDLLDVLLDKDNKNPIIMSDESGRIIRFEQVAVVPYNNELYCILKPIDELPGIGDDEAIVFLCDTDENGNTVLKVEQDEETAIAVFNIYYVLLLEANVPDGE